MEIERYTANIRDIVFLNKGAIDIYFEIALSIDCFWAETFNLGFVGSSPSRRHKAYIGNSNVLTTKSLKYFVAI